MLKTEIKRSGYRLGFIAKELGLSPYGFRKKVDGITEFKVSEVKKLSNLLKLSEKKRNSIFFNVK